MSAIFHNMKKTVLLGFLVYFFLVGMVPSVAMARYERSNWNAVRDGIYYKWVPSNWWSAYYLKEFDKVAPAPGADWMKEKTSNISSWLDAAREKGWVVKSRANEAKIGAIGIRQNPDTQTARLSFVREVYDWGIKYSYIGTDGEPKDGTISFSRLLSAQDGYMFKGYIWPEKMIR